MSQDTTRTQLTLHNSVLEPLKPYIPERKSLTQFVEDLLEKQIMAIDSGTTLVKPSAREVLPLKAVNKEKDVDFSLSAEEAHIPAKALEVVREGPAQKPLFEKVIPSNLFPHKDLLMDFWRVKKGSRSERAWKLYMTEAQKIQSGYGDTALREQLEIAAAEEFDGFSLQNYEKFGRPATNVPTQGRSQRSSVDWAAVDAVGSLF